MPFGLCNISKAHGALHGCSKFKRLSYLFRRLFIFSSTLEQHIERLDAFFNRLNEYNQKLKPSKCEVFKRKVTYLGHVVSDEGIQTDPEKT